MQKKATVAIIGTGLIAATSHIPAYKALSERCEIVACSDNREEAARFVAKKYNINKYYTDPQKMLEECHPNIVSICTPNAYHKQWSIAALKAGANVLCEKPICLTYADACEIYEVAEKNGKLFVPCQNNRFGAREAVRDLIRSDQLGEVYFAELECIRRRGIPTWGSFHLASESVGGPFCDVGIHFVDSLMFMLGNPKLISVSGKTWTKLANQEADGNGIMVDIKKEEENPSFIARPYSAHEFNVEDHAAGTMRFEKDLLVNFKFSWALNSPEVDGILLAGTKGGLVFNKLSETPFMLYKSENGIEKDIELKYQSIKKVEGMDNPGHFLLITHMLDALDGVEPLLITKEEMLNVIMSLEVFYTSAKENREVRAEEILVKSGR